MKRPNFNAASLRKMKTELGSNRTEVTFIDSQQNEITLNLSPAARPQLIQALLTRAPSSDADKAPPSGITLKAQGLTLYDHPQAGTMLEVRLSPTQSVHIELAAGLPGELQRMLQTWLAQQANTPTH